MLDLKFVRENPDIVKQNIKNKFQDQKLPLVDEVIALDAERRAAQQEADEIRAILREILPGLKIICDDAKLLANKYDWDMFCFDMCEAYMNLANAYIDVVQTLEEEDGGAK